MTATADGWIEVGRVDDVPLWEGRRVTVGGHLVAVFRTDAGIRAVGASCPHADGPLQDGLVAEDCVTCPLHGWRFSLSTGERLGALASEPAAALELFDVAERDGALLLRLPAELLSRAA